MPRCLDSWAARAIYDRSAPLARLNKRCVPAVKNECKDDMSKKLYFNGAVNAQGMATQLSRGRTDLFAPEPDGADSRFGKDPRFRLRFCLRSEVCGNG
jgi:hypothetical protein